MTLAAAILTSLLAQAPNSPIGLSAGLSADTAPAELEGIGIEEHLGDTVPLDLPLVAEDGSPTSLGAMLEPGRPVLLHMGYYRCPMLCSLVLNEAVRGLQGVDWSAGTEFDVVSVSINPTEGPDLAAAKKAGYVVEYGRKGADRGWHFLTGTEASTKAIADAVGFQYRLNPDGEYSHAAALFLIAPDGRIVRYLYGVRFEPATLRMALVEAGEGKIGSALDRFILWCHQYDPSAGGYTLFAFRLMQLGGLVTVVVLATGLLWLWRRDIRVRRLLPPDHAAHAAIR